MSHAVDFYSGIPLVYNASFQKKFDDIRSIIRFLQRLLSSMFSRTRVATLARLGTDLKRFSTDINSRTILMTLPL